MKFRLLTGLLVAAFVATSAWACPEHDKKTDVVKAADKPCAHAAKVKAEAEDKPCGAKKAKLAKDGDKPCRHAAKVKAEAGDKPCGKKAKLAKDGDKPCGKKAKLAKDGDKPCPHAAKAKLAGDDAKPCHHHAKKAEAAEGDKPCDGKKAKLAGDDGKPCDNPCDGKKAKLAKDGDKPCGAKKAKSADDGKPCGKKAKLAGDDAKPCSKPCDKPCGKSAKLAADGNDDCPYSKKIDAVLTSLPSVTYKVGDQTTCCAKAAKYMAEKTKEPMHYVVGDDSFEDEGKAMAKLAEVLEVKLASLESVMYKTGDKTVHCPVTAKQLASQNGGKISYQVAGVDFESKDEAEKVVKLAKSAAEEVKLKYKVGDETFCCDKMAGMKAKKSGEKVKYVVGDEETPCETQAKVLLNQARIRAAVQAAVGNTKL